MRVLNNVVPGISVLLCNNGIIFNIINSINILNY